jgi:hypothetical protein
MLAAFVGGVRLLRVSAIQSLKFTRESVRMLKYCA